MTFTTRFAPSPTGPLHLGHAYSALLARDKAKAAGGRFLLRIEDIDRSRARDTWEMQIFEDLAWLGVKWEKPVRRQSDNITTYRAALRTLWTEGLLFRCTCNRRDILDAAAAPQEGGTPKTGPDGLIYPGTCRTSERSPGSALPENAALRLDMHAAVRKIGGAISYIETGFTARTKTIDPDRLIQQVGDVVLARKDMGTSYHLSVAVDDAVQNITDVVRGRDLAEATAIHVVLQKLLHLPFPRYHHHKLIRDDTGKRLAKRDDARAIARYRADGATPQDIRTMVGL